MNAPVRTMALVLASALLAACGDNTEIVLVVGSDIPTTTMGAIGMRFSRADGTAVASTRCVAVAGIDGWPQTPLTQGIVPDGDDAESFRVTVDGYAGCPSAAATSPASVVEESAFVHFTHGERNALGIDLSQRCLGHVCSVGQTCDPISTACVSDTDDDLPPFDPTLSTPDFAAPGGGVDSMMAEDAGIAITELTLGSVSSDYYSASASWEGGFIVVAVNGSTLNANVIDGGGQLTKQFAISPTANLNRPAVTSGVFQATKTNFVFDNQMANHDVNVFEDQTGGSYASVSPLVITYEPLYASYESGKGAFRLLLDGSAAPTPFLNTSLWPMLGAPLPANTTLATSAVQNPVLATGPTDALVLWQSSSTTVHNAYIDDTTAAPPYSTTALPDSDVRPAATSVFGAPGKYFVLVNEPIAGGLDSLSVAYLKFANATLSVAPALGAHEAIEGLSSLAIASGQKSALCAMTRAAGGLLLARFDYTTGLAHSFEVFPGDTKVRTNVRVAYDPLSGSYLVLYAEPNSTMYAFVYPDQ